MPKRTMAGPALVLGLFVAVPSAAYAGPGELPTLTASARLQGLRRTGLAHSAYARSLPASTPTMSQGVIRLDMEARTIANRLPCVSPSQFTIGPNLESILTLPAVSG